MLKIGQIRKDTSTQYLQDLTFTPAIVKNAGYEGSQKVFSDFAVTLGNRTFTADTTYYVRAYIKRVPEVTDIGEKAYGDPGIVNFSLVLYQENGGESGQHSREKIQTIAQHVMAPYYTTKINDEWVEYIFTFTPNDTYKYLCFRVNRIGYDYVKNARSPFVYNNIPIVGDNTMDFNENGDLASVNNILPGTMTKIGIQSRPGTLFIVNKEPIILGRSGIYEINNGTKITSVGVAAPNGGSDIRNIQDFILDYGYDNSNEEG